MNERELDRAIDVAAETLMAREPGRALAFHVMARVRETPAPAPRPFIWIAAAVVASVALCALIATAVINQTPEPVVHLPSAGKLPVSKTASTPPVPIGLLRETLQTSVVGAIPRQATSSMAMPPADVSTIEPIEAEPIALSTIDVPQLDRETTSIESIHIEPITIEPLSASND